MNKSKIFSKAWKLANRGAKNFGGSAKSYFSESLRTVYAAEKLRATINKSRFDVLTVQSRLTREEAIELANYRAANAMARHMYYSSDEYSKNEYNKNMEIISELESGVAFHFIMNSSDIVIMYAY